MRNTRREPVAIAKSAVFGPPRRNVTGTFVTLLLILVVGCGGQGEMDDQRTDAPRVAQTKIERGPVTVTVEVSPEPARLSDEPTLTLTIDHEQGVDVEPPPFGESMGDFIIRDFREPLPIIRDQHQIIRQVYTLEPTSTGALQIDPIRITFLDARINGDGKSHTIETEALTLNVLSVVASDAPTLADLEGFAAPIDLAPSRAWIVWTVCGGIALLFAAFVILLILARRRAAESETQLTPRELANRELEKLWRDDATREDVKLFYVRLTSIVRTYIEGTTGVHAPEQTTEEFLREIGEGTRFPQEERERLKGFLESADLVKFAKHLPQASDIHESYHRARRFVGLTGGDATDE